MTSIMVIEVSCLFGGGLDLKWVIIPVFIGLILEISFQLAVLMVTLVNRRGVFNGYRNLHY